jgi:hypothetical protein
MSQETELSPGNDHTAVPQLQIEDIAPETSAETPDSPESSMLSEYIAAYERLQFDIERLKYRADKQNYRFRKDGYQIAKDIIGLWLAFVAIVVFLQGACSEFQIENAPLSTLIGSTTLGVVSLFAIVLKSIFPGGK